MRRATILSVAVAMLASLTGCYTYTPAADSGPCAERRPLAPGPTVLGVHGLSDPQVAASLGTPMVRIIVHDRAVAAARAELDAGRVPEFVRNLDAFHAAGAQVVLTLRWPVAPGTPGSDPDRIPQGADREAALEQVRWLARATAGKVAYIQVNNEPLGGPGHYDPDQADAAVEWMGDVAEEICAVRNSDPALADLRLVAPALTGIDGLASGHGSPEQEAAVDSIVALAESHFELLDIHLHATGVASIEGQLAWLRSRTTMPLASLEWSQAKAASSWLSQPADRRFGSGTNRKVVLDAYEHPMPVAEWRAFVSGSPHDPTFLADAFAVLEASGVRLAAYGGAWQYGTPLYDLDALYANRTVGYDRPNQPFHDEFVALAASTG